jgi:hypothetical protein
VAAPTFVTEYESAWNTGTTPKTISITTDIGDVVVAVSGVETTSTAINAPTGGTGAWVPQENVTAASSARARADSRVATAAETFTFSQSTDSGSNWWGFNALRFSGSDGIGAAESTQNGTGSAAPSLSITTTQANSAIVVVVADWNASDGASRTWRTVNSITPTAGNTFERSYFRDGNHYAIYVAYYPDAGAIGAKTVGLTAPSDQRYCIAAVEVKGTASAAQPPPRPALVVPGLAAIQASTW